MNGKPFFIHVGYPKTATSWLQEKLFSKNQQLNYLGKTKANYPDWLLDIHYLDEFSFNKKKERLKKFLREQHAKSDKATLISSEAFCNLDAVQQQAQRIKDLFHNPKIILVLRNPVDWLESFYKHKVRIGEFFLDLDDYLDFSRRPFCLHKRKPVFLTDLFYDEVIETYQQLFGKGCLLVLRYEEFKESPNRFVKKIGEFMNVDFGDVSTIAEERINAGPKISLKEHKERTFEEFKKKAKFSDEPIPHELREKLKEFFKDKCTLYKELNL